MSRPISKKALYDFWRSEYLGGEGQWGPCHCGICGNSGVIDTRGKAYTAAGVHCGIKAFCICPNGRAWKRGGAKL